MNRKKWINWLGLFAVVAILWDTHCAETPHGAIASICICAIVWLNDEA